MKSIVTWVVFAILLLGLFFSTQYYFEVEGQINAPTPPKCIGGETFSLAAPLPSSRCNHLRGTLYYYFTYSDKTYYAVVERMSGGSSDLDSYSLYLKKNNVILESCTKYQLTIFDENRKSIGSSKNVYCGNAAVEIPEIKTPTNPTNPTTPATPIIEATQKNDIVTITIQNAGDSSSDIYGIKLTSLNGKIKNFAKLKGWEGKRLGADSVMYQTKSSPLEFDDVIKIKLKVGAKKSEIQWEVFSESLNSIGVGNAKI